MRALRLALLSAVLSAGATAADADDWFVERAAEAGLVFSHFNGMSGRLYYPEVVGAGGALFDYDLDGDLDLYLVQGSMLGPDRTLADALLPPPAPGPDPSLALFDRLYRNELEVAPDGTRHIRFVDVTAESGIRADLYGMGAATGDVDNDGDPDLLVTNFEGIQLFRNQGDGTFVEVSADAGIDPGGWSVSASFADVDLDGWLDLFVVQYIEYSFLAHKSCLTERGEQDYCLPTAFRPQPDRLLHNLGGLGAKGRGRFEDISRAAGLASSLGNGLGVVVADLDGDGRLDFYVANDLLPNQLWINGGDLTFVDQGLLSGSGLNRDGKAEASMGVAIGDEDGDGDLDLFLTHFRRETNTLYRNEAGSFRDATNAAALALPSFDFTSFGTGFFDYDNDGWLDLLVASGAVTFPPGSDRSKNVYPFDETNQLFRNQEGKGFADVTAQAGAAFRLSEVSRSAIFGDVDNDGDTDVVITNNSGPVRLLVNQLGQGRAWLGVRLVVAAGDGVRDEPGTIVELHRPGLPRLVRRAGSDGSYAAASDPRVLFGLGDASEVRELRVTWPGGLRERFQKVTANRYTTLVKGSGDPLSP